MEHGERDGSRLLRRETVVYPPIPTSEALPPQLIGRAAKFTPPKDQPSTDAALPPTALSTDGRLGICWRAGPGHHLLPKLYCSSPS